MEERRIGNIEGSNGRSNIESRAGSPARKDEKAYEEMRKALDTLCIACYVIALTATSTNLAYQVYSAKRYAREAESYAPVSGMPSSGVGIGIDM